MATIGYARVSTKEQSTDIQEKDLTALGCKRVYLEKQSGSSTNGRTELKAMLDYAREGDTIIVLKLDRLARNTIDALNIIEELTAKGVSIKIMDIGEGQDLTKGIGKMLLTVMAAVAEMERERILERTARGREAAKEKGVKFGRKPTGKKQQVIDLHKAGEGVTAISKQLNIGRTTIYKYLEEQKAA